MTCERAKANAGRNTDYVELYLRSAAESVGIPTERHITNWTTLHTKRLAFDSGLRQCCTDIIRFSHGPAVRGRSTAAASSPACTTRALSSRNNLNR